MLQEETAGTIDRIARPERALVLLPTLNKPGKAKLPAQRSAEARLEEGVGLARAIDLDVVRYPHPIVISHRFDGCVGPVGVDDELPVRIGMFESFFAVVLSNHFQRKKIAEDRKSLIKRAALVVTTNQAGRVQHG
jgi:hypothetical protein